MERSVLRSPRSRTRENAVTSRNPGAPGKDRNRLRLVVGFLSISAPAIVAFLWYSGRFDPLRAATTAYSAGNYRSALLAARDRLKYSPNDRKAALLAGRCLSKLGLHDQAEEQYRRAGTEPMSLDDLQDRAYGLVLLEQPRRAMEIYEQILTRWPDSTLALKRSAAVYMSLKEWRPVLTVADRLQSIPGNEVAAVTLAGIGHHELKHYTEAVSAAQSVLELDPELKEMPLPHGLFWNNLALDLMAIGRTSEARDYLTRALQTSQDANLMELLGLTYSQEGEVDRAEQCWRKAVEWNPSNADALLGLGRLSLNRSQPREAETWLKRAVQASPDALEPVYNLARAYRLMGQTSEAEHFERLAASLRASQPARGGMGEMPAENGEAGHHSADHQGTGK